MHSIHDLVSTRCFNRGSTRFDPNEGALDSVDSTRYSKRGSTRCDPHEVALDLVGTRYSNEGTLDFDETRYQTLDFNQILGISHRFWATTEVALDSYQLKKTCTRYTIWLVHDVSIEGALDLIRTREHSIRSTVHDIPNEGALDVIRTR